MAGMYGGRLVETWRRHLQQKFGGARRLNSKTPCLFALAAILLLLPFPRRESEDDLWDDVGGGGGAGGARGDGIDATDGALHGVEGRDVETQHASNEKKSNSRSCSRWCLVLGLVLVWFK